MTTGSHVISGQLGIDVTAAGTTTPAFRVGHRVPLSDGSTWMYIKASGTVPQYACVGIDADSTATALTTTTAGTGVSVGIAQQALTSGSYYWVLTSNPTPPAVTSATAPAATDNYRVRVAASCAVAAKLATTAFGGTIDDTTAGTALRLDTIVLTTCNTAAASSSRSFRTSAQGILVSGTLAI